MHQGIQGQSQAPLGRLFIAIPTNTVPSLLSTRKLLGRHAWWYLMLFGCIRFAPRLSSTWLQLSRCTGAIGRYRYGHWCTRDLALGSKPWAIQPVHLLYFLHACIMALAVLCLSFLPVFSVCGRATLHRRGVARRSYLLLLVVPFLLHS